MSEITSLNSLRTLSQGIEAQSQPQAPPAAQNPPQALLAHSAAQPLAPARPDALAGASQIPAAAPRRPVFDRTFYIANDMMSAKELYYSINLELINNPNPNLTPIWLEGNRAALMPNNGGKLSAEQIADYVRAGSTIFEKIQNGYYEPTQNQAIVGEDEICSLMWYLQALAASKAASSR
ncbi:MAG: hypothetical protein LBV23_12150, partial [Deltaproteobacteria bacterium]|nr:hypothetical protein [Deltaproteobacteria bacterium]